MEIVVKNSGLRKVDGWAKYNAYVVGDCVDFTLAAKIGENTLRIACDSEDSSWDFLLDVRRNLLDAKFIEVFNIKGLVICEVIHNEGTYRVRGEGETSYLLENNKGLRLKLIFSEKNGYTLLVPKGYTEEYKRTVNKITKSLPKGQVVTKEANIDTDGDRIYKLGKLTELFA